MADLETLKVKRTKAKGKVSRTNGIISSSMSTAELELSALVEASLRQILTIQTYITTLCLQDQENQELEDLCIKTKANIIELLGDK